MKQLAAIAQTQLSAWEHVAREWPLQVVAREDGSYHLVCAVCDMSLIPVIYTTGTSYTITHNVTIAATVAHLRNVHRQIESEVYRDGR